MSSFADPKFSSGPIESRQVRSYYRDPNIVRHYLDATNRVGLWDSEKQVFGRLFAREDSLLELGCGAGRIAIGLYELGYRNLLATDFSPEMVHEGHNASECLGYDIPFRVADATKLTFSPESFQGVIFGFNGLMQIPGRERRRTAMREVYRVLQNHGVFVFTTHDRNVQRSSGYWKKEAELWRKGGQDPRLVEFGDVLDDCTDPPLFIHIPDSQEVRDDLKSVGFKVEQDFLRSSVANESLRVREFSDECRFWIARKPANNAEKEAVQG
jgi:ubiquinone/menaquinone biosynthesis C-methylase UbiE